MDIIIPDIKREYIYLEATEADKDKQFEQCSQWCADSH